MKDIDKTKQTAALLSREERVARLDDSVLRFLTVVADEDVQDVDARKAEAVELEQERLRKAKERAEREAEEAVARAEEELSELLPPAPVVTPPPRDPDDLAIHRVK